MNFQHIKIICWKFNAFQLYSTHSVVVIIHYRIYLNFLLFQKTEQTMITILHIVIYIYSTESESK